MATNDEALGGGRVRGELHRLLADHLAVAEAAVDEKRRALRSMTISAWRFGTTMPVARPVDIFADAHHAMGIVADEVGLDEMIGDGAGLRLVRSGAAEDRGGEVAQGLGCIALRRLSPLAMSHETPAIFDFATSSDAGG